MSPCTLLAKGFDPLCAASISARAAMKPSAAAAPALTASRRVIPAPRISTLLWNEDPPPCRLEVARRLRSGEKDSGSVSGEAVEQAGAPGRHQIFLRAALRRVRSIPRRPGFAE